MSWLKTRLEERRGSAISICKAHSLTPNIVFMMLTCVCLSTWLGMFHSMGRELPHLATAGFAAHRWLAHLSCITCSAGVFCGFGASLILRKYDKLGNNTISSICFASAALSGLLAMAILRNHGDIILCLLCQFCTCALSTVLITRILAAGLSESRKHFLFLVIGYVMGSNALGNIVFMLANLHQARFATMLSGAILIALAAVFFSKCERITVPPISRDGNTTSEPGAIKLILHLFLLGLVLGLAHIGMGAADTTLSQTDSIVTATTIGAIGACGLACLTLFNKAWKQAVLWQCIRGASLPLTIMGIGLLPLANSAALPTLFVELGGSYYVFLLAAGCFLAARDTVLDPCVVLIGAFSLKEAGFFTGTILGTGITLADTIARQESWSILILVVFVVFVVIAFWTGNDDEMRKWWGLRKELTPQRFHGSLTKERCDALAVSHKLSKRETEIISLLSQGKSLKEIKDDLSLSINTVRNHVQRAYVKLDVHSREELKKLVDSIEL